MYKPRFLVTQKMYDAATPDEKKKYNYVVVPDEPLPVPGHICCLNLGCESAEKRTETRPAR